MVAQNCIPVAGMIFDWDGTVADSYEAMLCSYRHAYSTHLGIDFPADQAEFRRLAAMRLAESSAHYGGARAAAVAQAYNDFYNREGYTRGRLVPGMGAALAALQARGQQLGLATNKGRERVQRDMEFLGLAGLFTVVVTAEDTHERKPHPAPLLLAARRMGLEPAACAYVGDYPGDIVAAHAAGMLAVAVLWGFYPEDELRAQAPHYLLRQPDELLAVGR